jgi:site-specific recombinase XerD
MLLTDAIAAYVAERADCGEITAGTAAQLAWRLTRLAAAHPGLPVDQLTRQHITDWQRTTGWQRPATRRGYQSTLKVFCAWAVDGGLLEVDPTVRLARLRDDAGPPRTLSPGRVKRLKMALPDDRARLIVALMHELGLRCVEVARLQTADWDSSAGELRVVGKGGHVRYAEVVDDLADTLDRWCAGRAGPIVGITAERISLLVSTWMDAAGLKTGRYDGVSAHALRHTAANNLLDGCGNVRIVQQFLGHASLATTDRYLRRHSKTEMRDAMRAARRAAI